MRRKNEWSDANDTYRIFRKKRYRKYMFELD